MIGVIFSISCLIFIGILQIFYLSKKRLNTINNKIFSYLISINIIEIIIDVIGYFTFKSLGIENPINIMISKIYIVIYLCYVFTFMLYIYNISTKKLLENFKKFISLFFVSLMITVWLPIKLYFNNGIGYTYGLCVNLGYSIGFTMLGYMIYVLIKNFKNIKFKEYLPLIVFTFLTILVSVIQKTFPEITILLLANSIVTFLMYFTIENPDMKLLEELNKSKEVSDTANEEKTVFIYNMTQEIRNTTSKINENIKYILDCENINDAKELAREVLNYTSEFKTTVNDILDIDTTSFNSVKVYKEKYNFKNLIKEITKLYTLKAKDKNIEFRIKIDNNIPEILYGDSINLKKILYMILDLCMNNK